MILAMFGRLPCLKDTCHKRKMVFFNSNFYTIKAISSQRKITT